MELNDKVTQLEDEIKILKNEVQAVLLDVRDTFLSRENPFNPNASAPSSQPIIINNQPPPSHDEPSSSRDKPIPIPEEHHEDAPPAENQESELPEIEAPADEPELVAEPEIVAAEETAHEEVKRVWRPEIESGPYFKAREAVDSPGGKADVATIAGLFRWVTEATRQLGRERTEVILDISEMMGHLLPDIKKVLVKIISLTPDEYSGGATTRDYLVLLIELDTLLGKGSKAELALLSILSQENGHR